MENLPRLSNSTLPQFKRAEVCELIAENRTSQGVPLEKFAARPDARNSFSTIARFKVSKWKQEAFLYYYYLNKPAEILSSSMNACGLNTLKAWFYLVLSKKYSVSRNSKKAQGIFTTLTIRACNNCKGDSSTCQRSKRT